MPGDYVLSAFAIEIDGYLTDVFIPKADAQVLDVLSEAHRTHLFNVASGSGTVNTAFLAVGVASFLGLCCCWLKYHEDPEEVAARERAKERARRGG